MAKANKTYKPGYRIRSLSWAGYLASNGIEAILIQQLTFYLTESVMLSVGIASAIIAVSRVFDGISDIIAGFIIDRTHTKWGNARPYTLMTIVMWGAAVLLFSTPNLSTTGKIIYVFIMYNLADTVGRTFLFASEGVHLKKGFYSEEQLNVLSISGLVSGILSMVVNIMMPVLINRLGNTQHGWTVIALVFAVPGIAMALLKFFFIPELDMDEVLHAHSKSKIGLKNSVAALFRNKYLFIFEAALFLKQVMMGLGVGSYYFKYVVGDLEKLSLVSACSLISFVAMPLIPTLSKKMGIKNFMSYFLIAGGLGCLAMYLAPRNMGVLALGASLQALGVIPLSMLMSLIAVQCMKYTEWKEDIKIDGLISSMNGVSQKAGAALGALLSGLLLSASGYVGNVPVQSENATSMLIFIYCGLSGILLVVGGLILQGYNLEKQLPQIEKELEERAVKNS